MQVLFVKATYNLEGDGPLALTCYNTVSALNVAARQAHYCNLWPLRCTNGKRVVATCKVLCPARYFLLLPTVINKYKRASSSFQGSNTLFTFQVTYVNTLYDVHVHV